MGKVLPAHWAATWEDNMKDVTMDQGGTLSRSVVALLSAAARQHVSVTRMSLAKLLYLADLQAVEAGGDTVSGAEWRWLNYGPYDKRLRDVEVDLIGSQLVQKEETSNFFGNPEFRLYLVTEVEPQVPAQTLELFNRVISNYGRLAPTTLKDITYQTAPILEVQAHGERGDWLDLYLARPVNDVSHVLSHFREVARSLSDQKDTEDGTRGLLADIEAFSPLREEANRLVLG